MIKIETISEFLDYQQRGYEPLANREVEMPINVRRQAQAQLFGKGHSPAENERFYRYCWAHKIPMCEECGKPLRYYSATYVSHILTRGSHPEMAHDIRNVNILCFEHHQQWETGDRQSMRIYEKNLRRIEQLKQEYNVDSKGCGR